MNNSIPNQTLYAMGNRDAKHHLHMGLSGAKEEAPLSTTESELREVLSKVDERPIIGACIVLAIRTGKPSFRKLITELKDQLRDAPSSLKDVIGERGIELLKRL